MKHDPAAAPIPIEAMRISMPQRIGLVAMFGGLVPAGLAVFPIVLVRCLSRVPRTDDIVTENWIVLTTVLLGLLGLVFFYDVIWQILVSARRGYVDKRLLKRFGSPAMAKWFGLPFKG